MDSNRLVRQIAGQCVRCGESAAEGSDYCAPHHEDAKRRSRESHQRRRLALSKAGKCAQCGRATDTFRCKSCLQRIRLLKKTRESVNRKRESVSTGHTKLHVEADGYQRQRYVGRSRRGALTKEERNAELLRDVEYARIELGKFVKALALASSEEVAILPTYQKEEVFRIAADHPAQAARLLAAVSAALDKRNRKTCCVCGGEHEEDE